jgi:mitogen-activated protein kinase kinase kinase 11
MRYSGTVTHMPPELIEEGKVYQQGDVYAFGIMMWEVSMSLHVLHRY